MPLIVGAQMRLQAQGVADLYLIYVQARRAGGSTAPPGSRTTFRRHGNSAGPPVRSSAEGPCAVSIIDQDGLALVGARD